MEAAGTPDIHPSTLNTAKIPKMSKNGQAKIVSKLVLVALSLDRVASVIIFMLLLLLLLQLLLLLLWLLLLLLLLFFLSKSTFPLYT